MMVAGRNKLVGLVRARVLEGHNAYDLAVRGADVL